MEIIKKKTLAMTGQNGASSKLGTKGGKQSLSGREEKKTEASVKWDEGAEEVQSWQVDFCLTGQPFKRPPPPPIRNATISFRRKKKSRGKFRSEIIQQRWADQWFDFQREAKKATRIVELFYLNNSGETAAAAARQAVEHEYFCAVAL